MRSLSVICAIIISIPMLSVAKRWDAERGKALFETSCAACHGSTGEGNGPAAVAIKSPKPRNFKKEALKFGDSKEAIFKTITEGSPGTAMPPWKDLPIQDRQDLAAYVKSLVPGK